MSKKVVFSLAFTICTCAFGNPQDGTVVSGDVVFRENGSTLTIEASDRSIIHWQDFSIGQGETTEFVQPTSNAAVLNRVTSDTPSQIFGSLLANGHVYLMNPNGILVGASGVINTGGFLATTLDQGPSNFFENGALELLGDSDAAIVNLGNITATGDIFLVARKIDNQGVIKSTNGMVGLAAGKDVLLKESGEERIFIRPVGEGEINSTGTIEALNIEIKSRGNPYSMAINLDGQLTANKVNEVDGRVFLSADNGHVVLEENTGIVANEVTIDANIAGIQMSSGSSVEATDRVTISAVGGIQLSEVVVEDAGSVLIKSEGAITDASINDENNINITAGTVSLITGDDIYIGSSSGIEVGSPGYEPINISPNVELISVSGNQSDYSSGGLTLTSSNSGNNILGYDSFNISAGDTAYFVRPSGIASVLNRINSDTPSQILGTLSSNGIVYLVNPSGLVIQPIVFRPLTSQSTGGDLSSPLFFNAKSSKPVVQNLQSPVLENNAEGTLLAKFSTQAEDDGKSVINLDR